MIRDQSKTGIRSLSVCPEDRNVPTAHLSNAKARRRAWESSTAATVRMWLAIPTRANPPHSHSTTLPANNDALPHRRGHPCSRLRCHSTHEQSRCFFGSPLLCPSRNECCRPRTQGTSVHRPKQVAEPDPCKCKVMGSAENCLPVHLLHLPPWGQERIDWFRWNFQTHHEMCFR